MHADPRAVPYSNPPSQGQERATEFGERNCNAYRRPRPAGVRQGGARGAAEARREHRRRLRRADQAGREGRPAARSRDGGEPAGLSARLLQGPEGVGGIPRAEARPAGDGVRHAVRAGRFPQHSDPRLDPVSPLAAARLSRRERDQLADHQGREGNRALDLLARQRARYRRRPDPEEDADLRHRHARHGVLRPPVPDGRRGDARRRGPREGRQGAAHQAG